MRKKRIRMFAGPNGSGKSTLKELLEQNLIGTYINPDEIEKSIVEKGVLDLSEYAIKTSKEKITEFFRNSLFLKQVGLHHQAQQLQFVENKLIFHDIQINAYFASVAADFIRHQLLETSDLFTFETVMSSPDKVEFLRQAQKKGYRTYLYYVATEDPSINVQRVKNRIANDGHSVPEDKIHSRYYRSLDLLISAVHATNRAYIFDNSLGKMRWIAEITEGKIIEMRTPEMPAWLQRTLGDKFVNAVAR